MEGGEGRARACAQGLPPFGMARLIDISDETHPKIASRLMLQVDDPDNCATTIGDNSAEAIFSYDTHYCSVDDVHNTSYVACDQFQSGVRVYDVTDPYHPKEGAYYHPPARRGAPPPARRGHGPPPARTSAPAPAASATGRPPSPSGTTATSCGSR